MATEMRRVFTLDFKGTAIPDAIVKVKSASIGTLLAMLDAPDATVEMQALADHIVEWDLVNDGVPIPLTLEGVRSLEEPAFKLIVSEWLKATRGISAPLDKRSASIKSLPEEPITMETL